ncbi:unnamed protein product [Lota lota]
MAIKEQTCRWGLLLPLLGLITCTQHGLTQGCVCPRATVVTRLPAEIPREACCLNYSGSALGRVSWPGFGINSNNDSRHRLKILDLSYCNITHIELSFAGAATQLKEVHLHHNRLVTLPEDFLAQQPSLQVLDLGWNQLLEVPEGLLRGSEDLRRLDLGGNRLRSLEPVSSVLRMPHLRSLELDHNPWDCSCSLVELLVVATATGVNGTVFGIGGGGPTGPAGNLTCASPRKLEGASVRTLTPAAVCQPPGLTALFILLPLLLLAGLLLCWCCGRKRKRRKDATFGSKKRKSKQNQKDPAGRDRLQKKRRTGTNGDPWLTGGAPTTGSPERGGGILKNQLLLRPASALLSSTRDIYEEVEVEAKMGSSSRDSRTSVTSTEEGGSGRGLPGNAVAGGDGGEGEGGDGEGGDGEGSGRRAELDDVVSVSEVLKDSANREKAYLVQSTEYYSLLPGMDLGDSDHGEYESVDLT